MVAKIDVTTRIDDTLLAIADLAREYVDEGRDVKRAMAKQLKKLDKLWGEMVEEIVKGER